MAETSRYSSEDQARSLQLLPVVLLLFVGSGCAALIYEIVWLQLLQLVIGSSAVSLGVLLGTFMGGMCLGSLLLPRVVSPRWHPLVVYGVMELGISLIAMALLFGMPWIDRTYASVAGHGFTGILIRGVISGACLLPPTLLMGATLPAVARWVRATPQGVSWLGFFYGGNIAGAVLGCLLAGFYLLREYDMEWATYAAVAINVSVAAVSFGLAGVTPHRLSMSAEAQGAGAARRSGSVWIYLTIGVSGFCALACEVIWTRLLSLLMGATVYTFSIILAVFLTGLGLGSSAGSFLARSGSGARTALACCQLLLTGAIAWTAYALAGSLPYWPIDPSLSDSAWVHVQLDLARCLWAVLPPACLWGASFPLALAAVAAPGTDLGRLVGGVYAANTAGAIAGALGASLLLVGWLGTQHAQQALIGLSAIAALILFAPDLWRFAPGSSAADELAPTLRAAGVSVIALTVGAGLAAAWSVPATPGALVAYGRYLPSQTGKGEIEYMGEGTNASIAVTKLPGGVLNFHVSGKIEASSETQDMRLQRMLGHIPALMHPEPKSILVVGCGAGVTAGSFVLHPSVEKIVICEIEPLIPQVVARYFSRENHGVLDDPRVTVVHDDARHYVLTTKEKFDVITSDPIHPWVKGAATLYTEEYFQLCRQRLNPGGVITQWVPLYESNLAAVKSEIGTFFRVFPSGTIWSNDIQGEGYDVVLLGRLQDAMINVDDLQARLDRADHELVALSLDQVGFESAVDLLATYGGQRADLATWLQDAQINLDRNLRLQYLAGLGLNQYSGELIYETIKAHRRFPDELFHASGPRMDELKQALGFSVAPP